MRQKSHLDYKSHFQKCPESRQVIGDDDTPSSDVCRLRALFYFLAKQNIITAANYLSDFWNAKQREEKLSTAHLKFKLNIVYEYLRACIAQTFSLCSALLWLSCCDLSY